MSEKDRRIHNIDEKEEARMLAIYMESGNRRLREAMAAAPEEKPQADFDRFARGEGADIIDLPAPAAAESGHIAVERTARIIPFKK